MSREIFIPAILIALVSSVIFLLSGSLELFSYSGVKFMGGEIWRLITFQFAHTSLSHLLENLIALLVVTLFAKEINLPIRYFLLLFFMVSMGIALFGSVIFPLLVMAGASLGIYGILGGISMQGSSIIPRKVLIVLLGLSVFAKYLFDLLTCSDCITNKLFLQTIFHFSGFLAGLFIIYPITIRKKRILTGDIYEKS